MKFQDFTYARPNMEAFRREFEALLEQFRNAPSFGVQSEAFTAIHAARREVSSMLSIARIRHTINTTDPFYKGEQEFIDEQSPVYQGLITDFYKALVASVFRPQLEAKWGKHLFASAELSLKTFDSAIVEDLQAENKKSSEYASLVASAKIEFDGRERTLSQLAPYLQSTDRDTRKRAADARYAFFEANEETVDGIYDTLVHLRTDMARKLGYRNFIELAYARMGRTDYGPEQVAAFRKQVHEHIVPVASEISERRRERLDVESLRYYDGLSFLTGNPTPKGNPDWIVSQAKAMYREMSPETDEFFRFMLDGGLMDLESKPGKRVGGYCSSLERIRHRSSSRISTVPRTTSTSSPMRPDTRSRRI
jgi:M3 family oligoendopeptidase